MMRIRLIRLLAVIGVLWVAGTAPTSAQDSGALVLQLVNQVRASYGLAGFTYNAQLAAAAQAQANWMAANGRYVHNHGGSTPQTRANAAGYVGYVSENIVGGTDLTAQQGVVWWQNSATHFNTMISTRYTEAGVGVAAGLDQNFYVLVVGQRSDKPVTAPQPAQANAPAAYVAPIVLAAPAEDGSIVHTIQSGHTLWAIAARYEVPIETLLLYNNLTEDAFLQPGDELLIRLAEGQAPPPTPTPPAAHVVRAGETAWTIAAKYRISLDELLWLNGFTEDEILQPGDEVIIRLLPGQTPPPTPTPQLTHVIQNGQTLWEIALTYGLTLDDLLAYNGITVDTIIREGAELYIRPPMTPTPVATPPPPQTATPTAVSRDALAVPTTPTATEPPVAAAVAPASTATPIPTLALTNAVTGSPDSSFRTAMLIGTFLAGLGLTSLAVVAAITIRKEV